MTALRIASIDEPFRTSPGSIWAALETLRLLEAMGLLAEGEVIDRLDRGTIGRMVDAADKAGISPSAVVPLRGRRRAGGAGMARALDALREALEESPVPAPEWRSLGKLFGTERLAQLTGVSPASLRRYAAGQRATPDDVAARLHYLAKVVGDLRGAYNDIGVRRWFERKRTALDGRAPEQLLGGEWTPEAEGPMSVRQLARSLSASAAT